MTKFLAIFPNAAYRSAMGNLRPAGRMRPFELFSVALLKSLKYAFCIGKSIKPVEKVPILALDMTVKQSFAWGAHGAPSQKSETHGAPLGKLQISLFKLNSQ